MTKQIIFEGMSKAEYEAIKGKYITIILNDLLVIALLGNLYYHDMTESQINYIKKFYRCEDKQHQFENILPDDIAKQITLPLNNYKNGFIIIQ